MSFVCILFLCFAYFFTKIVKALTNKNIVKLQKKGENTKGIQFVQHDMSSRRVSSLCWYTQQNRSKSAKRV